MFHHVLPNILSPVLVRFAIGAGVAVTAEGALSFLGLGVRPPTASWGNMLSSGNQVISQASFLVYAPGAMILITVLSFSLLSEGLQAAFGTSGLGTANR
jgi:peptide/nickel transport system permease protein